MLTLMETANETWDVSAVQKAEELEVQAVDAAAVYEDVLPALAELKEMGLTLALTSSLSHRACSRFLERFGLKKYFAAVSARGDDGGVKVAPLARALTVTSLRPDETLFLADTLEGIKIGGVVGLNVVLMMNDPDEAMRLAEYNPAGIVSLHELPDFIRLVQSEVRRPTQTPSGTSD